MFGQRLSVMSVCLVSAVSAASAMEATQVRTTAQQPVVRMPCPTPKVLTLKPHNWPQHCLNWRRRVLRPVRPGFARSHKVLPPAIFPCIKPSN